MSDPQKEAKDSYKQENDLEVNVGNRMDDGNDSDEVFAKREDGPDFRNVTWTRAAVLIIKTQVGLGVLSIPNVFHTLGFFPGIFLLTVLFLIILYGGYVLGQFKFRHRQVHTVADIGFILAGPIGKEVFGAAFFLFTTFVAGSGLLSMSIALNAMSTHAICTMGFVAVSAAMTIVFGLIKTLGHVSWLGWVGVVSIIVGVLVTVIGVGVEDRPAAAPPTGPLDLQVHAFNSPEFSDAFVAIVDIIFSFCGTSAFLPIISEMKEPKDYYKSLFVGQTFVYLFNLMVGVIVYYYCGQYVASPALGSAGELLKKISYGLAFPALVVTCILYVHFSSKYLFVRILRNSRHLQEPTFIHWVTWVGVVVSCAIFSFIIASAIPFFSSLVGLVGALFGSPLSMFIIGWMWYYDYGNSVFPKDSNGKRHFNSSMSFTKYILAIGNVLISVIGLFCTVAGTYASAVSINNLYAAHEVGDAFSCADNSNSVH